MGERRGQGVEGMEGAGWLPTDTPSSLPLPCFFYLLSVPMLMSCDVQGEVGREGGPGDTEGETQKQKRALLVVGVNARVKRAKKTIARFEASFLICGC